MTDDSFNKCVKDDKAIQALNDRVERHYRDDHVNSTPTFVINGKSLEPGFHTLDEIDAAIKAAGASGRRPPFLSPGGAPPGERRSQGCATSAHTGVAKIAVAADLNTVILAMLSSWCA